jgi:hypothetical protein
LRDSALSLRYTHNDKVAKQIVLVVTRARAKPDNPSDEIAGQARNDDYDTTTATAKPPRCPSECPFYKGAIASHEIAGRDEVPARNDEVSLS